MQALTLTQNAVKTLEAKMEREWAAMHEAKKAGATADAKELKAMYDANGFRLAKLMQRLKGE